MDNIATVIAEMEEYLRIHDEGERNGSVTEWGIVRVSEVRMERWVALLKEAKREG